MLNAESIPEQSHVESLEDSQNGKKKVIVNPIAEALERFLRRVEDLRDAALVAGPAIGKWQIDAFTKQKKNLEKYVQKVAGDEQQAVAHGVHAASDMLKTVKEYERLRDSKVLMVLMRSLFVGIFSEYDVFIGDLLQAIHEKKPDLFKGIRREITLSELLEFPSVEAVKQDILDKEIDSFRRNSYVEQFAELESKFDVKLRSFTEWPDFVELGQRRNLMTHNGGICSEQYILVCEKSGHKFVEKPKCGDDLMPSGKYFMNALLITSKVAFMLTHTLWRKLMPDDIDVADTAMNNVIFDLLSREWWQFAAEFGKFGLSEPMLRKSNDLNKRIRLINAAIGLKHTNKLDDARALLKTMDWTASLRDFQLAIHILKGEYKEAAVIMKFIGKSGEIVDQLAYHTWPLFQDFRDQPEFHETYELVYKTPFIANATKEAQAKVAVDTSVADAIPLNVANAPINVKAIRRATKKAVIGPALNLIGEKKLKQRLATPASRIPRVSEKSRAKSVK